LSLKFFTIINLVSHLKEISGINDKEIYVVRK